MPAVDFKFLLLGAPIVFVAACTAMTTEVPATSEVVLRMASNDGSGALVGIVRFYDSQYGLMIEPDLRSLEAGPHAAHIHENPDCRIGGDGTPAGGAGHHYDPDGTNKHAGPYGDGHRGDLPNLIVEADGTARIPMLAPRLSAAEIKGRSLMIHAGADRFDTHSMHHHGTGGPRMYCGVIQ